MTDTQAQNTQIREIVEQFRDDQKISCPETIYQSDRVIENAYELIEKLIDVVGYWKDPDEVEDAE